MMRKKMKEALKRKNKGFTLVELIIVVAVIAVLAAVLAPQYLQYVEKSRESNDLQIATNIVRAATVAISDPKNDIPAGYYIEILWITGDESGATADPGDLMVRYSHSNSRVSVFSNKDGVDDVLPLTRTIASIDNFSKSFLGILGDGGIIKLPNNAGDGHYSEIEDGKSKLANAGNLSFHINTTTGEVALAGLASNPDSTEIANRWVELGLPAIPAP